MYPAMRVLSLVALLFSLTAFALTPPDSGCLLAFQALGGARGIATPGLADWLADPATKGADVVAWLSRSPWLNVLYDGPSGTWEGYTVREHTLRVLAVYESQRDFYLPRLVDSP